MRRYNPKEIEPKWQKTWEDSGIYRASEDKTKPKRYVLEYFPYPSGAAMHVGHVRNYTIGDAIARYNRMLGHNVLHPMGWDAFGLPAENYAIKTGISPRQAVDENTKKFKKQLMQMGFSYDWTREVDSTDPNYYKWTQWFFLMLFKRGLAYQQDSLQWWCPVDKTVLANEQVEAGKCWRCGSEVEKKALKQWFFKITDYADRLEKDLDDVNWSESIKSMQRNWIGKSKGAEVDFVVDSISDYVLLHGFTGSPKNVFFPWLTKTIEKLGGKAFTPDLPNTDKPNADDQAEYVLKHHKFTENTVLLGHSYGSVTALKLVEKLKTPIKKLVLVAGFAEPGFLDRERNFEKTTNWQFDFAKIRKNVKEIVILRDLSDSVVPKERANYLSEQLGGRIVDFVAEEDHVCGKIEPVVLENTLETIRIFTTRPDTLFGATFMVLAPEHPMVNRLTIEREKTKVENYVKSALAKSDVERQETEREKTGVFTGAYATNPVNGEKIPIWVADYVLMGYGTGAIMAVPAHDERDFEFANRHNIAIRQVVVPQDEFRAIALPSTLSNSDEFKNELTENKISFQLSVSKISNRDQIWIKTHKAELSTVVKVIQKYLQGDNWVEILGTQNLVVTKNKIHNDFLNDSEKWFEQFLKWEPMIKGQKNLWDLYGKNEFFKELICNTGEGILTDSGDSSGMSTSEAREKIVADLAKQGTATEKINYKMRDWLISRQRYWGAPIPIIHCPKCGAQAVPENDLPVKLPEIKSYEPSGDGRSPLANVPEFVNTTCPNCGGKAQRETDTMDGFACSSWYFLRFADPNNKEKAFDPAKAKFWLPVDDYIGGAEHAVMHLLYARFWVKVMQDEGLVDFSEPFTTLRNQGMILAPDGAKMSKSKNNTIEPDELLSQGYGADSVRLMELFIGPWDQSANWSVEGMGGTFRFLQRVWTLTQEHLEAKKHQTGAGDELARITHKAIKKVTEDMHELGFNTAIAALMEMVNELYLLKVKKPLGTDDWASALETLIQLLAPFAPHISEELWHELGHQESVHVSSWPNWDEKYLVSDTIIIVVQVNGKVRANIEVPTGAGEKEIVSAATSDAKVAEYIKAGVLKTVYVPSKLVNFVIEN